MTSFPNIVRKTFVYSVLVSLLLLLSSCSILRLSYNQGPQLVWWWLDDYVNFSSEQAPHAKEAIRKWFDWHRAHQLPQYAAWLAALGGQIGDSVTAAQVCDWFEELRGTLSPAIDQALLLGAPLVPSLGEAQLLHLEQRYAKSNEEFRRDYLQPLIAERREASLKRTVKRVENLYGRIEEAQLHLISASIAASPYDPEAWLSERQHRQNVTLQTLRQLIAEPAGIENTVAALRQLAEHTERSTNAGYRAYQMRLNAYNCAFIATVHNSTTLQQRKHARNKLKGWENDLHILASANR